MPDWMSAGAHRPDPQPGGDGRPGQPRGGRLPRQHPPRRGARARRRPGAFLPRQFSNEDNCEAHDETTGPEIWWQLASGRARSRPRSSPGVGTGGTIMGAGRFLREQRPGRPAASAGAGELADPVHRPQGRQAPHPGHLRRVHPADRRARPARRGRRGGRRRRHPDGAEARRGGSGSAVGISSRRELPRRAAGRRTRSAPTPWWSPSSPTTTRSTSAPTCCARSRSAPGS